MRYECSRYSKVAGYGSMVGRDRLSLFETDVLAFTMDGEGIEVAMGIYLFKGSFAVDNHYLLFRYASDTADRSVTLSVSLEQHASHGLGPTMKN